MQWKASTKTQWGKKVPNIFGTTKVLKNAKSSKNYIKKANQKVPIIY